MHFWKVSIIVEIVYSGRVQIFRLLAEGPDKQRFAQLCVSV